MTDRLRSFPSVPSNQPGIRIWPLEISYASGEVVPYGISIDGLSLGHGGSTTAGSQISSVLVNYGGSWVGDVAAPNGSMTLVQTVDYDIDGVFNRSTEDFVCVDVDRDRALDCGPDGAERFRHEEPFTLDGQQLRALVAASGHRVELVLAESATMVQTLTGAMPVNTQPSFAGTSEPGGQTYTVGTSIEALTLPTASGGDGTLTFSLTSSVPGLSFDAATRQLTGTPTTAGTYIMTYNAEDEDGDFATLVFTITVNPDSSGTATGGDCYVGLIVRIGESCTYPGTTDAFTVNERGRGSFLTFLAGIRIRINNQTINGRVYDFLASHQGDGVWRIDRVAGST